MYSIWTLSVSCSQLTNDEFQQIGLLKLILPLQWWQVLSLGAGQADLKHELAKAKKWGMTGWVRPLMNIMMEGTAGEYTWHGCSNLKS